MKEDLQVQKDFFVAPKLKIGDKVPQKPKNYVKIVKNYEELLPEG